MSLLFCCICRYVICARTHYVCKRMSKRRDKHGKGLLFQKKMRKYTSHYDFLRKILIIYDKYLHASLITIICRGKKENVFLNGKFLEYFVVNLN